MNKTMEQQCNADYRGLRYVFEKASDEQLRKLFEAPGEPVPVPESTKKEK